MMILIFWIFLIVIIEFWNNIQTLHTIIPTLVSFEDVRRLLLTEFCANMKNVNSDLYHDEISSMGMNSYEDVWDRRLGVDGTRELMMNLPLF